MPESKKVEEKKLSKPKPKPMNSDNAAILKSYRQLLLLLFFFASASIGFYIWVYEQTGIQQTLTNAGIIAFAFGLSPFAYLLAKAGKHGSAGILAMAGAALAYGGNELTLKGLLPYHLVGGIILIVLVGNIVFPKKWLSWLFISITYAGGLLLIDSVSPLLRYNASASNQLVTYAVGANILLGLVFILHVIWFTQRLSIRKRLITAFVLVVLIPTIATNAVTFLLFTESAERQVVEKLQSIAFLKEAEIRAWKASIEPNLLLIKAQQGARDQIGMLHTLAGNIPSTPISYRETYDDFMDFFELTIAQTGIFDNLFIMDLDGNVILSTDNSEEGTNHFGRDYYNEGMLYTYLTPPFRSPETGRLIIIVVTPYKNQLGETVAILGGHVSMKLLNGIMLERAGLGDTGETYLVSPRKVLITESRYPGYRTQEAIVSSEAIDTAVMQRVHGKGNYISYRESDVIGVYRWLPELQLGLITEQERKEAFLALNNIILANLVTGLAAVVLAIIAGLLVTQRITTPLNNLGKMAERIAAGNHNLTAEVEQRDEIGVLASSFNSMTAQLRSLIGSLEQRVAERTKAVERRSLQLRVAAEVARDASAVHDMNELLTGAVNLIRDRFGFYHAGIFLLDEKGEYALLTAATGEAGKEMLERGHRLKVGETGLVGYVASVGHPRVASEVGADSVHFKNPSLPETKSEVALPLKIGQKVIGAVDVQSIEKAAFDEETVEVLQIMTDQLAVAIENARLLKEMERTVKELETAYGSYTSEAWQEFLSLKQRTRGYRYRGLGAEPIKGMPQENLVGQNNAETRLITELKFSSGSEPYSTIAVPMQLRGQNVGTVNIRVKGSSVPPETVTLFEEVTNRLSMSLENVRLLEEAQLRSEQLRLLQDITSAAAAYINLDELMGAVTEKIRVGFNLSFCSAILFSKDKQTGEVIVDNTTDPSEKSLVNTRVPVINNEAFELALHTSKAVAQYSVQKNPCTSLMHEYFTVRATEGLVLAPVISRGEIIGLLTLESKDPNRRFVEDELRLIDQISLQVSTAIDVARLFEQTEQRAERERLTGEITTHIRESLEINAVLKTAAFEMRRALNLEEVELRLGGNFSDKENKGFDCLSFQPENSFICTADDEVSPAPASIVEEMILAIQIRQKVQTERILAVPIEVRGEIAGVVRFQRPSDSDTWNKEEIQLLEALTVQLGLALESARLYDATQRKAERERLISDVTSKLRASTNLDTIMQTAVQELAEALQIPHGSIVLRGEGGGFANE